MSQRKADFIKIPTGGTVGFQTMPVEPEKRIPESEISIELCDEKDAEKIAEGLYASFPEDFWSKSESLELRPEPSTRVKRLTKRILPTFTLPHMKWIKAVLTSTGEMAGVAGWSAPGSPVHTMLRRSAIEYYGWQEKMGWSNEEIDEMWEHVDIEAWDKMVRDNDDIRKEVLGDEPHWFLAPLLTWPEYQGRGIGKRLLDWAIQQADATEPVTPMYLESAPTARAVYMHCGFVPLGVHNFLRRGPAVVRGLEAEEEKDKKEDATKEKLEGVNVEVVEKETEANLAH